METLKVIDLQKWDLSAEEKLGMGCTIETTGTKADKSLWEEIENQVKNIDWSEILDKIIKCDWPIDSAITSELFDEDDMKIIKILLMKAIKKMSVVNQYKLYNNYS
jgi:hypothetical protein